MCEYIDSPSQLARCDNRWVTISEWVSIGGATAACPTYYTAETQRGADTDAVVSGLGCPGACVYTAQAAVMFLHCDHRDEYTAYRANGAGCVDVQQQHSDGRVYRTTMEYEAANPCP